MIGVLAKFLKDSGRLGKTDEVVGTVMSNFGLEKFCKQHKINFVRTKVGDRYIVERMKKSGAIFGGEPSGHIIFKDYATTGDGILAALKVVECLRFYNKSLDELIEDVQLMPQKLINVPVSKKTPFNKQEKIQEKLKSVEGQLADTGRVLLRYSGTENLARIMVEGEDEVLVNSCCKELAATVEKVLG